MPNTFLKTGIIANTAVGLLQRQLVIARTVWTDAINPGEFTGALNDTVNMRVPTRRVARKRTLRAGTPIVNDVSTESSIPVRLTTDVYNGAPITDEELTLDIVDFGAQILNPQILAVVEGMEEEVAAEIEDADYGTNVINPESVAFVVSGQTDWYRVAVRAARMLDDNNVPVEGRTFLVGAEAKESLQLDERFIRADSVGAEQATSALRERTIGRIAGFNVVYSPFIDPENAYAYHRTAFVLATRAPAVPAGAAFAQIRGVGQPGGAMGYWDGLSVRWLRDYDYTNTTDRSLVNAWVGTATVTDPVVASNPAGTKSLQRAVKITAGS